MDIFVVELRKSDPLEGESEFNVSSFVKVWKRIWFANRVAM